MVKNINTTKPPIKTVVKIISAILLAPFVLIILGVSLYFGTKPILDSIDHDKFTTLDAQMQSLYKEVKTASNGIEDWKYSATCISDRSGWMETGVYHCVTSISTKKTITTVQELNDLQAKYYPVINNNDTLTQITGLKLQSQNDFGNNFVVSSAAKDYKNNKSGIECSYLIKLYQNKENDNLTYAENISYGSEINYGLGNVLVSLRCQEVARDHWYPLSESTDLLIP